MKRTRRTRSKSNSSSLQFESLEKRDLLAASVVYDPTTDYLTITGNSAADLVQVDHVSQTDLRIKVTITENGQNVTSLISQPISRIFFYGGDGNDLFTNNSTIACSAFGNGGNDVLTGGSANDFITGQEGDDTIDGRAGNDELYGYLGNDVIIGGAGDDYINGFDGNDKLFGGEGKDSLWGGNGDDFLFGEAGDDVLEGQVGNDLMDGGAGNDKLYGWLGNDKIYGGAGNDYLSGYDGIDQLFGGDGADSLWGGNGDDQLSGGNGVDWLDGGAGSDQAWGDGGLDRYRNTKANVPALTPGMQYSINAESGAFVETAYGSVQNDSWSCGPNSAFRFLQTHGKNVSYETVRSRASSTWMLSKLGLGLTASRLRDVINGFGVSATAKYEATLTSLLAELANGKPVVALLQVGTKTLSGSDAAAFGAGTGTAVGGILGGVLGGIIGSVSTVTIPCLHWVTVNGYDVNKNMIHYVDTDGKQYSKSYANFSNQFGWNPAGFNPAVRAILKSAGLKTRTFIS